jgi:2-amino-4-hydroxy-6-hydroxymethyldihydropteridine diphosphokinase
VTTAYVGIGSNLKDPRAQVLQAFNELDGLPHTRVVKKSSLYRSAPMGHAAQPDFINAVAQLETGLPAERLLAELQEVEARHGRERSFPNAWTCCCLGLPSWIHPHSSCRIRACTNGRSC